MPRFATIRVRALDRSGAPVEFEASGYHARVLQHEIDHSDGLVYLDRMRDMKSLSTRSTSAELLESRPETECPVRPPASSPLHPCRPDSGGLADFFTTRVEALAAWARKNSLWPFPFATACCGIEFMSVVSSHYDLSRFGAEVVRFSPRQADLLIVAGTVTDKLAPMLRQIYDQMPEPKWVISMGVCASSGGFYRAYHVTQGIDEIVPVDVYVPGCPPTPEELMYGILELQKKITSGEKSRDSRSAQARGEQARLSPSSSLAFCPRPAERLAGAAGAARRSRVASRSADLDLPTLEVAAGDVAGAGASCLRDDPECRFDLFLDLARRRQPAAAGRGRPGSRPSSTSTRCSRNEHVRVKVLLPDAEEPSLPTVVDVWPAANWFEREAYDLFGFDFPGHPNLRRILCHDAFVGHPLRKDYAPGQRWFATEEDLQLAGLGARDRRARRATSRRRRSRSARRTRRRTASST